MLSFKFSKFSLAVFSLVVIPLQSLNAAPVKKYAGKYWVDDFYLSKSKKAVMGEVTGSRNTHVQFMTLRSNHIDDNRYFFILDNEGKLRNVQLRVASCETFQAGSAYGEDSQQPKGLGCKISKSRLSGRIIGQFQRAGLDYAQVRVKIEGFRKIRIHIPETRAAAYTYFKHKGFQGTLYLK